MKINFIFFVATYSLVSPMFAEEDKLQKDVAIILNEVMPLDRISEIVVSKVYDSLKSSAKLSAASLAELMPVLETWGREFAARDFHPEISNLMEARFTSDELANLAKHFQSTARKKISKALRAKEDPAKALTAGETQEFLKFQESPLGIKLKEFSGELRVAQQALMAKLLPKASSELIAKVEQVQNR